MASFLAIIDDWNYKRQEKRIVEGAVLPIDSYRTEETGFAEPLSHGGALYLVATGDDDEIWLVAVLESPETSGLKKADRRPPGWYAPPNTTPVTDIRKLKRKLGLRGELGDALDEPLELTPKQEAAIRELLGDVDAPVLGVLDVQPVAAPEVAGTPLERAASYLAGSYVTAAIEAMNEAWREKRVPELADLIDRASRVAPGHDRPLFDRRVRMWGDSSPMWDRAFAGDPIAAMPQLLLNLSVGNVSEISTRATKLAELPEDPRLGRRLAELIPAGPGEFNPSPDYWTPIIALWIRGRDLRLGPTILEGEGAITGKKVKALFEYARKPKTYFEDKPPVLTEAERALCASIERELVRLEEPFRLECDLVDAIAAHPDDDAARQIYADRLQERGHPRGEYIALACQKATGSLTPALARRFAQLAELPYLCGPLDDLATRHLRPHDRGIDRHFDVTWKATTITWFEVAAHPLARAFEKLELIGSPKPGRVDGIVAVARVAAKLARIDGIGAKTGKAVAAKLEGWKMVGDALVRA